MVPQTTAAENEFVIEALERLAINSAVLFIIIKLLYNRYSNKRGNFFAFFLMGTMIFMLCIVLKSVELQMGMALGLFALFSIIRYRTRNMAIKDMAYLFTVIGISALNALIDYPHPIRGTILVNSIIILTIFLLEISSKKREKEIVVEEVPVIKEPTAEELEKKAAKKEKKMFNKANPLKKHQILYDNLSLLNPDKMNELKTDVSTRIGVKTEKIRIRKINLVAGNAELDVYYRTEKQKPFVVE
jgi:ribosomal protein L24